MKKRLICIGDSITHGTFTDNGESAPLSIAHPNFAELLQQKLDFEELINYGKNGISYSSMSPILSESALTKTCGGFKNGDIVILAAGTNDYGTNVPLGTELDENDTSFFGAVDEVLRCLVDNNENGIIFVILPIPRQKSNENELGFTLDEYRNALKLKATKYHLPVIDGRKINIDPTKARHRTKYMPDGTHPNVAGHKMYAELLYSEIITYLEGNQGYI